MRFILSRKEYIKLGLIPTIYILLFFAIFKLLQNDTVYSNTLGRISQNYLNENGIISQKSVAFTSLQNKKFITWDAVHYHNIKENRYKTNSPQDIYIYAFFPLFPMIWKLSTLDNLGISILNYIFFSVSILILIRVFRNEINSFRNKALIYSISLCSPLITVYLIPYTEAIFTLTLAIAILGFIKNKYWLYFIGMLAAAMTRSAITILLLCFISCFIIDLFKYKNYKTILTNFLKFILPSFIGTLLVCVIQLINGSGKLLIYIDAIKTWNNVFRIPHNISDWSHESFGIAIGIICIIIPSLLIYLSFNFISDISKKNKRSEDFSYFKSEEYRKKYMFNFSAIYILGVFFAILMFKDGLLNGIPRYVLCSPFLYFILYSFPSKFKKLKIEIKLGFYLILSLISIFFLGMIPYSTYWDFSDTGLFILIIFCALLIFLEYIQTQIKLIIVSLFVVLSIVWNTYLFNMFLSNAWIFT